VTWWVTNKESLSTKVVHCKKKFDVFIGRPSEFGNPFVIGKDGNRRQVIDKYRDWILTQPELLEKAKELKDKTLGCFCIPAACHGHILAAIADNFEEFMKNNVNN